MSIKQHGGIFGRNPKLNNVEVSSLTINGNTVPDASTILVDSDLGSSVQAYDAGLDSIAGLTTAADKMIYSTASDTYAVTDLTSAGRAILGDADASAQRTTLGLGTMATQDSDSVNIDGGTIDGATIATSSASLTTLNTSGAVVFNEAGADVDFRVEGDNDANLLVVNAGTDAVVFGASAPLDSLNGDKVFIQGGDLFIRDVQSGNAWSRGVVGFALRNSNGTPLDAYIKANRSADVHGNMEFYTASSQTTALSLKISNSRDLEPGSDDAQDIGSSGVRWDDVYATNGTIQTSDQNEKQQIRDLSDAEKQVAQSLKSLVKAYKWNNSVGTKGDAARTHIGMIAQDVEQAFSDAGLNASEYGLFIKSEWWTDPDGNVYYNTSQYSDQGFDPSNLTRHERLGLRYNQVFAFIVSTL
jgi:hypothetical protein